ncbi:unnamed protein product [Penicillium nalgiovense]|nr:unnamed protein product [Penicillium nalgiovense]
MVLIYARCPEALGMWRITRSGSSFHVHLSKWFLVNGADPNRRSYSYKDCTPISCCFIEMVD